MNSGDTYRKLSQSEINTMVSHGCSCDEWDRIEVTEGFDPSRCSNVIFSGDIKLGRLGKVFPDDS